MVSADMRRAVVNRDLGVRRITMYSWWIGAIAATVAAMIMFSFGRHPGDAVEHGILVPGQPPAAAHGPGTATSGAS
jgi:hypothetical protein